MHELSLAQNIVGIIQQNVPRDREEWVKVVRLRVGELSGVVPESLEFCFCAITSSTPLESVKLEIERVPFRVHCRDCGEFFNNEIGLVKCPSCSGVNTDIVGGTELNVVDIEVLENDLR